MQHALIVWLQVLSETMASQIRLMVPNLSIDLAPMHAVNAVGWSLVRLDGTLDGPALRRHLQFVLSPDGSEKWHSFEALLHGVHGESKDRTGGGQRLIIGRDDCTIRHKDGMPKQQPDLVRALFVSCVLMAL